MNSINHFAVNNNRLGYLINQLAANDNDDDSLPPLSTTNNNHCNTTTQQQTTTIPFSMLHFTGNTPPIVHQPNRNRDTAAESMLQLNSSSGGIWRFLIDQIRNQLRRMSPSECAVCVRELQMMSHSELLLRSGYHLNGMSPLPLVGRQHHTSATTGYLNRQHDISSSSPPTMQSIMQQPDMGSSTTALFSPMGRDLTTSPPQSRAPPSSNAAETELEEVSSSPSKMMKLSTVDDDDGRHMSSRISEEPLISSVGLKLHRNKDSSSVRQPNIQKKKDTLSPTTTPLPPSKKISSTKKKSATKSSPAKGCSSKVKKGFALPRKQASIVKKTRAKKKTSSSSSSSSSRTGVKSPSDADVLCGRGYQANNHKGNMQFRDYVMQLRCVYQEASKAEKTELAKVSFTSSFAGLLSYVNR